MGVYLKSEANKMPWDAGTFKERHNKGLSKPQAAKASKVANAILRDSGDEGKAIRIANWQAKKTGEGRYKSHMEA
jgi:uncharacterized protein YdaT